MKISEKTGKIYKRNKRFCITALIMCGLIVFGVLLSLITAWADFYTDHIYFILRDPISRITEIIPFPLGEVLMYLGAALVILAVPILILLVFLRKKRGYKAFASAYFKSLVMIILTVLLIYTFQWLTPYRSSVLGNALHPSREYSARDLQTLYIYLIDHINEECINVPRDENGNVIYDSKETAEQKVSVAMNGISGEFPRLRGYYPAIKAAMCSDVLDWMYIGGYTYPYTLEPTYNRYINRFYFPLLYAHESSHHMGYYKEHEANFLSYLACSESDDPVLRYSAYYYTLSYVNDAYYLSCLASGKEEAYYEVVNQHPILGQVITDVINANREADEIYLQDEHPLQEYSDEAEEISEVGWDTQAEILQDYSYDYVVDLLLWYYDGKLF